MTRRGPVATAAGSCAGIQRRAATRGGCNNHVRIVVRAFRRWALHGRRYSSAGPQTAVAPRRTA